MPNTVLNVIVAEAIDRLAGELEQACSGGGKSLEEALPQIVRDSWNNSKQVVFNGDNYSEEWHKEAEQRGLLNLRTTPDALPQYLEPTSIEVFGKSNVLYEREIEARYEVFAEQYATLVNIEAETAATIARTQLLPAAVRHLRDAARGGRGHHHARVAQRRGGRDDRGVHLRDPQARGGQRPPRRARGHRRGEVHPRLR